MVGFHLRSPTLYVEHVILLYRCALPADEIGALVRLYISCNLIWRNPRLL